MQDAEITAKPSDRAHERRLAMLKQESAIIRKIFSTQETIFNKLDAATSSLRMIPARSEVEGTRPYISRRALVPEYHRAHHLRSAPVASEQFFSTASLPDIGGFRQMFARECVTQAIRMYRAFWETEAQTSDLEEFVSSGA